MAKNKDIAVKEDNAIANVASENALDFLNQHVATAEFDPGFMRIKVSKGTKTFSVGELGTKDSPLECIVLSVNKRRGLWPPDKSISKEQMAVSLEVMPDDVKMEIDKVNDWRVNRPLCGSSSKTPGKGVLPKIVDPEAPELVSQLLKFPSECDFVCAKCKWNEYQTDFKGTRGKGCKESRLLLLYFPGEEDMVATLSVPPTSIRAWTRYKTSLPRQNFASCWTAISTRPAEGDWEYNFIDFDPAKDKGKIVRVEPDHLASLGENVLYKGVEVSKIEAYITEFGGLELEEELDYLNGDTVGDDDVPFGDSNDDADF